MPRKAKAESVVQAPAAEEAKKTPRVFMNRVPQALIHDNKEGVKVVSIPDKNSANNYSSIFVSANQIIPSTKRDTKEPIPGLFNINLGNPERDVKVSRATGFGEDGKPTYESVTLKAQKIADMFKENQQEFYAQRSEQAKEAQAGKEAEAEAEPEV